MENCEVALNQVLMAIHPGMDFYQKCDFADLCEKENYS